MNTTEKMSQKQIFAKVAKLAHKVTKNYRKKFKCTYHIQFGIFFKLFYGMFKSKIQVEKMTSISGKKIYSIDKNLYSSITNKAVQCINFFVRGDGLNFNFFTSTLCKGQIEYQLDRSRPIEELLECGVNIIPLLGV